MQITFDEGEEIVGRVTPRVVGEKMNIQYPISQKMNVQYPTSNVQCPMMKVRGEDEYPISNTEFPMIKLRQ